MAEPDPRIEDARTPVPDRIRERIVKAGGRFHANDNKDTAGWVAKMYLLEVFGGRYVPAPPVTEFPNVARLNELMIVGPITVRSACSHHLCPIVGRTWVGVMPNESSA